MLEKKKSFQADVEFNLETDERIWDTMYKNHWDKAIWNQRHNLVHKYVEGQTIIMNDKIKNYWTNRARVLFSAMGKKLEDQLFGSNDPHSVRRVYKAPIIRGYSGAGAIR
jgi:hypothetical protein